ncbi:MAG: hypothetical protein AAB670_01005 [Patescibacteria group bacterium]
MLKVLTLAICVETFPRFTAQLAITLEVGKKLLRKPERKLNKAGIKGDERWMKEQLEHIHNFEDLVGIVATI